MPAGAGNLQCCFRKFPPFGINKVEGPATDADPDEVKGLGDHPKVFRARLDDGLVLQAALEKIYPDLAPERFLAEQQQDRS